MKKRISLLLCAVFLLTGCGKSGSSSEAENTSVNTEPAQTTVGSFSTEESTTSATVAETAPTTEADLQNASFDDIKNRLGVSEAELERAVRRSLVQSFDRGQINKLSDADINKYYSETIFGRVDCIKADPKTFTYSVEGGDVFFEAPDGLAVEKKIGLAAPSSNKASAELGFVSARLDGDRVFVKLSDDEDNTAKATLFGGQYETPGQKDLEFDKEYELTGLYSRYTDIFITTIGNLYLPVIFLTTEDGCLELFNIKSCFDYGQLCPMPIPGDFKDCRLMHPGSVVGMDESAVCAATKDNEYIDLSRWVNAMYSAMPAGSFSVIADEHTVDGGSYCDIANIVLDAAGSFESSTTALDSVISEGYGTFKTIGMNDNGLLFSYFYLDKNRLDPLMGVVAKGRGSSTSLDLHLISGEKSFSAPTELESDVFE